MSQVVEVHVSRVVILSGRSLFVEGIASRLKQQRALELVTVDSAQEDALAQVIAARPTVVILDSTDPDVMWHCPLSKLLSAMPSLKVIRLDPQQEQVQVVSSEQRPVGEVRDLIEVIGASN